MGHNVGKAADNAVEKSKKKEAVKNRTEGEIVRDIELNLNAGLSVAPLDIRLLLNRYKEWQSRIASLEENTALNERIQAEEFAEVSKKILDDSLKQAKELSKIPEIVDALAERGLQFSEEVTGGGDNSSGAGQESSGTEERSEQGGVGEAQV